MSRQCLDGVASLRVVPSRVCSVTRFLESISEEPEVENSLSESPLNHLEGFVLTIASLTEHYLL